MKPKPRKPSWWSSGEWSTPQPFLDALIARHGPFTLDVCARPETAKAPRFYTIADDGLRALWYGKVWCNPPYSNPRPWIEKAVKSTRVPHRTRVTMLLPAATDTGWFHDLVLPYASVELLRGRLKFLGWEGTPVGSPKAGNILAYFPHGWARHSQYDAPPRPRVWHVRDPLCPPDAVYVGRPTRWGNPYRIDRDGTREEVIAKHRASLVGRPTRDFAELRGKDLSCWCWPKPCHASNYLDFANV